jgi:hypothetical protein
MRLMRSPSTNPAYVFAACSVGIVALIVVFLYANSGAQVTTTSSVYSAPVLNFNYLTAAQAREYGIHDLLNVSAATSSIVASPGQKLQIPLKITLEAFDNQVSSVTVFLSAASGQEAVGSLDVSGHESYSSSTLQLVANQSATVTMYFTMPNYSTGASFQLSPSGITVVPSNGVAILIDTNILVSCSP